MRTGWPTRPFSFLLAPGAGSGIGSRLSIGRSLPVVPVGRVVDNSFEEGRLGFRVSLRHRDRHTDSQNGGKNQDDFLHFEVCSSRPAT